MNGEYQTITIDGKSYAPPELKKWCRQQLENRVEDWEKDFYHFLLAWIDTDLKTIAVNTSGSTGVPKSINIEKDAMIASARMTLDFFDLKEGNSALLCLPCQYIAGKMMVVRAFVGKLNLIPVKPSVHALAIDNKPNFAAFTPLQMSNLLRTEQGISQIRAIKNIIIGGAPVSEILREKLSSFPNHIYETFGMTETVSHIALKLLSKQTATDCFMVLDKIKIETDERGCLIVNAPQFSPERIVTNDLVEIMDKKRFRWLGRMDNVVNSGSIKLLPEQLENKIRPLIHRRFIFSGIPDPDLGEKLILIIEGKPITGKALIELKQRLSQTLSKYEIPKDILFVDEFVSTSNGKIQRERTMRITTGH